MIRFDNYNHEEELQQPEQVQTIICFFFYPPSLLFSLHYNSIFPVEFAWIKRVFSTFLSYTMHISAFLLKSLICWRNLQSRKTRPAAEIYITIANSASHHFFQPVKY